MLGSAPARFLFCLLARFFGRVAASAQYNRADWSGNAGVTRTGDDTLDKGSGAIYDE
jgi:hypothetical protein